MHRPMRALTGHLRRQSVGLKAAGGERWPLPGPTRAGADAAVARAQCAGGGDRLQRIGDLRAAFRVVEHGERVARYAGASNRAGGDRRRGAEQGRRERAGVAPMTREREARRVCAWV